MWHLLFKMSTSFRNRPLLHINEAVMDFRHVFSLQNNTPEDILILSARTKKKKRKKREPEAASLRNTDSVNSTVR